MTIQTPDRAFAVVAYDQNRVIGFDDDMPYDPRTELRTDNEHLWALLGNPERPVSVIGGRNTLLPLLGRILRATDDVIIVSRNPGLETTEAVCKWEGRVRVASNPLEAVGAAHHIPAVFGGESIYRALLGSIDMVVATEIATEFSTSKGKAPKVFPELPAAEWQRESVEPMVRGAHDRYDAEFVVYKRR